MKKEVLFKWVVVVVIIFAAITYLGCEKKNDMAEHPENDKVTADTTTTIVKSEEPKDTIVVVKITIPDLKGKWTGMFDKRSTVLDILEQTDSSFSGKISISYRTAINQEVKGTFSPSTRIVTMTDQLHSRYQGKYKGELSTDNNNFSGTFTMDNDGTKYSFNLNKK